MVSMVINIGDFNGDLMVISWVSLGIDGGLSSSKRLQKLWKITMFKWVNSIANCKRLPEGTGEFFYACVNLVEA